MSRPNPFVPLLAFLTLLNDRLGESIVFPLLPFLLAKFTTSAVVLGSLASCYLLGQLAFTPLIGALSDRYGRKPVIVTCVAGSVLGLALFAVTITIDWSLIGWAAGTVLPLALLFLARLIDGVSGGTAATAAAVLADISTPENRARAFGLIGAAFGLGFIFGPGLGGLLAGITVNAPVWAALWFASLNLVLVVFFLPETNPREARRDLPRKRELNPVVQLLRVFRNRQVRRLCLAFCLFFLAFSGFTALLVLYFKEAFGWGPGLASIAFLVVGVVATVVQGGLIGPLVKRFGEFRLTLAGVGFVIIGCVLIPLASRGNAPPVVFTAVAILALGTGLVTPSLRALVSRRLEGDGQGAALGSLQSLQSFGSFLGPLLAGLAFERLGPRSPFWLSIALLVGVALLVAGGLKSEGRRFQEGAV